MKLSKNTKAAIALIENSAYESSAGISHAKVLMYIARKRPSIVLQAFKVLQEFKSSQRGISREPAIPPEVMETVKEACKETYLKNGKIHAIKLHRRITYSGLIEAKRIIETWADEENWKYTHLE